MRLVTRPIPLALAAIALLGLVFGVYAVAALGALGWVATLAFLSFRASSERRHDSAISAEGRAMLRPIKDLRNDIAGYVSSFSDRPRISVIGGEALREADTMIAHAERLVDVHDDLIKSLSGRSAAEEELARLKERRESSASSEESESLGSAVAAREAEIGRYRSAEDALRHLTENLREAEAALSEIKARLASVAVSAQTDDLGTDDLAGMVSRLRTLSTSFDEAEEMIEGRIE